MRAQVSAYTSWAHCEDRAARTAPARQALLDRFERQVDPDGVLTPTERATRAMFARKAYFAGLALKSAQSRRRAAEARQTSVELERQADDAESELAAGGTA